MEGATKFVAAIASLLGAIAWPLLFAVLTYAFRVEVRSLLARLPLLFDRMRKFKGLGFEAELDSLAADAPSTGEITHDQIQLATRLAIAAPEIGSSELLRELDGLCLQYDAIRREMVAGPPRTREMTRIVVKMRAVGPSVSRAIDIYKGSGSAGSRLAAIAMMQMEPIKSDISWLEARFASETPFVFYHAALALTNAASVSADMRGQVVLAARSAQMTVKAFRGEPDRQTIDVLDALVGPQSTHA